MGNPFATSEIRAGFYPANPYAGVGSFTLDHYNDALAMSFVTPAAGKTLNKVYVYCSAKYGTLVSGDLKCEIWNDSSGSPGSVVSGGTTTTVTSLPTGAAWVEFTGLTAALTGMTQYWVILTCPNAASGRYVRYNYMVSSSYSMGGNSLQLWGWMMMYSEQGAAYAGRTWGGTSFRLEFSDSSYYGLPISSMDGGGSSVGAHGSNMIGSYFTTPANASFKVIGLEANVKKYGSPGDLRLRLYNDTTLVDTATVSASNVATEYVWVEGYFSTVRTVSASATTRIMIGATAGDSSNYYNIALFNILTGSGGIGPMGGTWKRSYFNGSTWAENSDQFPCTALKCDTDGPFAAISSSGMIVHPGMVGGMRG